MLTFISLDFISGMLWYYCITFETTTGCLPSQGSQGKVREFTLLLKSQGKVREFSEKSGKSQGILVKSRNLFLRTAN